MSERGSQGQPAERTPLPPQKERGFTRRDFLVRAGLFGLTVSLEDNGEQRERGGEIKTWGDVEMFKSKYSKVEYPKNSKTLTHAQEALIGAIWDFQEKELLPALGITEMRKANVATRALKEVESAGEVEARKMRFWAKLREHLPDLPRYSPPQYYKTLVHDIPRMFARYGVFVKPVFAPTMDIKKDAFLGAETLLEFFKVKRVDSDEVSQWGRMIVRDVVTIDGPFIAQGRPLAHEAARGHGGQTFYQDVFVYEETIAKEAAQQASVDPALAERIKTLTDGELLDMVLASGDQVDTARNVTIMKLWGRAMEHEETAETRKAYIITHETGHIGDAIDSNFKTQFTPPVRSKPSEYLKGGANLGVHEEINGLLTELRYAKDRITPLLNILTLSSQGTHQDFEHDRAARWIFDHLVAIIRRDPDQYGLSIDGRSRLSSGAQSILQLPELLDREEALNKLAETLMQEHQTNYGEDFGQEYLDTLGVTPNTGVRIPTEKLVGVGVLALAALGIQRFLERRTRLIEEQRQAAGRKKPRRKS